MLLWIDVRPSDSKRQARNVVREPARPLLRFTSRCPRMKDVEVHHFHGKFHRFVPLDCSTSAPGTGRSHTHFAPAA